MARKAAAAVGPKGAAEGSRGKPERVTVKLSLDRETARVLKLEAFGRDVGLGVVVAELVRSAPRRFVLVDRSKVSSVPEGPATSDGTGPTGPASARPSLGVVSDAG